MPKFVVTGASGFLDKAVLTELPGAVPIGRGDFDRLAPFKGAVCVHLAGPSRFPDEPAAQKKERDDALRMADRVLAAGFSRIVLASSSAVYGEGNFEPNKESSPTPAPSPYGKLKLELEKIYAGHASARLTNLYGAGMSPTNVFSHIIEQLRGSGEVKVRNLTSVRDYLYVSDAAKALVALAKAKETGAFNVSTGRGASVAMLIRLLSSLMGRKNYSSSAVDANPPPSHVVLDPSRLKKTTGWAPQVPLEEGLKSLIEVPR